MTGTNTAVGPNQATTSGTAGKFPIRVTIAAVVVAIKPAHMDTRCLINLSLPRTGPANQDVWFCPSG